MRFSTLLPLIAGCQLPVACCWATDSCFVEQNTHSNIFFDDTILQNAIIADSLSAEQDTVVKPDAGISEIPISKDTLDAPVKYAARDSIVYDVVGKKVHLYGEASASYKNIQLKSDYIEYDWSNSTLTAEVRKDTAGNPAGYADFSDGANSYKAKKLAYNFKTTKGKVYQVMTQEGEGYIHSEAVKRQPNNEWYGYQGKYTTCNLEEPHFYFRAKRMKVVPDKVIATGPANMVVADVPLPVYLPFAIFPIRKGQRSGILLPEWGEEQSRGFFLRNGGYYFAISDYVDLALRGDIYTSGSWAIKANSVYRKRYHYNGNIRVDFGQNRLGEPESPDFNVKNDFRVNWNHSQETKAALNSRFTANVNFGSSSYDKNFSYDKERVLKNMLASKISYSKSWAGKPFSLSLNLAHDQNLNTGQMNLQLPVIAFGISRIQPFQPKRGIIRHRWYHDIGFSYNFEAQNVISGNDSSFLEKETFRKARYGVRHSVPVSSSLKLFKYFTLAPRFNYTERWYFQTISRKWDPAIIIDGTDTSYGRVVTDTIFGFAAARDFNAGASLTTKLYGQVNFKGKLKAIRHVFTPSLNVSYVPDFGKPHWGYYKTVQVDTSGTTQTYSIFEGVGIYGSPSRGLIGSIGLNLSNVLEMKVFSKKDTVKHEKKIALLESFSISGSYNLAADSLNLSTIGISGRTSFAQSKVSLDFGFTLDPYTVDSSNRRINKFVFEEERHFTRLSSARFSLSTRFQSKQTTQPEVKHEQLVTEEEKRMIEQNRELYYDFTIPWSFTLSYRLGLSKGDIGNPDAFNVSYNSVDFNFDANITPKWKMNLQTGFDFDEMDFVYTAISVIRDLHCWVLRFDWVPYPKEYQRYAMQLNVKSSILQDLKLTRKRDRFDGAF
ncbi:MAG TPA: putative LPS assembly protein LptD [Chitinophagales bacterium]|nr:putative LPS assembly protein LptD [Chitinophagales bacterium]